MRKPILRVLSLGLLVAAFAMLATARPVHAFSFSSFSNSSQQVGGADETQAGGHPYTSTVSFGFDTILDPLFGFPEADENPKDIVVGLPAGFVGDPTAAATCTTLQLTPSNPTCPIDSQVGIVIIQFAWGISPEHSQAFPVYNLQPGRGQIARIGFNPQGGTPVNIIVSLRNESDYGVEARVVNVPEAAPFDVSRLVLWGNPSDPSHDAQRGGDWVCFNDPDVVPGSCIGGGHAMSAIPKPFLTNPTFCGPPLKSSIASNTWQHPNVVASRDYTTPSGMTGCDALHFEPSISVKPDSTQADTPTGLTVDLSIPQNGNPNGLATPTLRDAEVSLPAGIHVSPSSADGLGACTPAEIGLVGSDFPEPNPIHFNADDPRCPGSSKIGSAEVVTPVLDEPLHGSIYLAAPHQNPFGSLLALYLVIEDPERGLRIKLAGKVEVDPNTGRLTTTFDDTPQLPFSELHLELKGGPRAPLSNPHQCGTYTTATYFTPWSAPLTPVATPSDSFTISGDGNGAPCPAPSFSPKLTAGTLNPVAGGFSLFSLRLQRSDQDGEFYSLSSLSLPPGLLADVGSVSTRCSDAQATVASCPAASHIGEVSVGAGAGSNPFYVGGDVYLTGPYKGDPFGLAIVVHALAGPFDLGYVVVRAAIRVNSDGSITTRSDPFPTILQGIPLQVRDIRVNLDRPGFVFNPTSCAPMSVNGTVLSTDNQRAGVSSRFQVGECSRLRFAPKFSVSTSGKTSKASGASLRVHLATHQGPSSNPSVPAEADLSKVEVQLPAVLPAKLSTLQKACTSAQFERDPAACPSGSFVGSARAHTPLLANPLSGPAILVSHGGVAFPDLVLVLQGEGIRLDVTGHTQIKNGVTFSRFQTVPDAPVSSFDLNLPQGSHAVLAANASLCANTRTVTTRRRVTRRVKRHAARKVTVKVKRTVASPLLMPTTMTAQNGAVIHQTTKIAVTGCPSAKSSKHAKKAGRSSAHARHARRTR